MQATQGFFCRCFQLSLLDLKRSCFLHAVYLLSPDEVLGPAGFCWWDHDLVSRPLIRWPPCTCWTADFATFRSLQLDYLDLFLVHWPVSMKPSENKFPPDNDSLLPMDFKSTWAAMEECQTLGLTKSIGVSNFSSKKLAELLCVAKIPPAVNQVEMHPVWQQRKLREFCKMNSIQVTAYSPLGAKGAPWGTNDVMDNQVLKEIAEARGKTVAQVALRWIYEQGAGMVVKSFNKERMKENLQIFDWGLTESEAHLIGQIPQRKGLPGDQFISASGPYKTLEELWDGEI